MDNNFAKDLLFIGLGFVFTFSLLLIIFTAQPNDTRHYALTEQETVILGCRGVCENSDAYDPDMILVRSCETILKTYGGKCFGE